jgi:protein gp37
LPNAFAACPAIRLNLALICALVPEKKPGDPLRWSTSRKIFVNSMSDLFHEKVPDEYIVKVARVMKAANWHTYQILTKRAGRMQKLLKGKLRFAAEQPHIWLGVSVENRQHGLPRIDLLRDSPAQVAQPSSAAGSGTVPVRVPENGGETPQPAGGTPALRVKT